MATTTINPASRCARRSYRAEPAHRSYSGLRAAAPREVAVGPGPLAQQTAAPRWAADAAPVFGREPGGPSRSHSGL